MENLTEFQNFEELKLEAKMVEVQKRIENREYLIKKLNKNAPQIRK